MIKSILSVISLVFLLLIGYLVISNVTGYIDCNNKRVLYKTDTVYMMVSGCMVKHNKMYIPIDYYEKMKFEWNIFE